MNKGILLSLSILFSAILTGMCTTYTISNSGFSFTPDTITIVFGDDVDFSLGSTHNAIEVSQETWDDNGTTALESGFSLPFGGGSLSMEQLTVGTHWYVCSVHASSGMKGVIIVESATGIKEDLQEAPVSFFPNPFFDILTIESDQDLLGSPFSLLDLTGKVILSGRLYGESVTVDVSHFDSGIYLLQIGERRRQAYKVIKK